MLRYQDTLLFGLSPLVSVLVCLIKYCYCKEKIHVGHCYLNTAQLSAKTLRYRKKDLQAPVVQGDDNYPADKIYWLEYILSAG